ncbi:hypothetical protein [Hyalangium rubrum]|uniref:Lipoprotein n=1 Tax=Hyalangium rubrum TaxID=3103134 RepID=A0ABU5HHL7_9BACT|nr:hypothetical protein [Hyalangium sp. s54d21]MDY7232642.1 hypothetical protein [Hyalangium sp. s54d21]
MRLLLPLLLVVATGCGATVRGSPLSNRPSADERGVYLSTGGAPRAYRTLGFAQVTGYGVTVAGVSDMGEAGLDGTIRGTLSQVALGMGGDGVIHIEFNDENPPTEVERVSDLSESVSSALSGSGGGVKTRNRSVVVTGEVIQFLSAP